MIKPGECFVQEDVVQLLSCDIVKPGNCIFIAGVSGGPGGWAHRTITKNCPCYPSFCRYRQDPLCVWGGLWWDSGLQEGLGSCAIASISDACGEEHLSSAKQDVLSPSLLLHTSCGRWGSCLGCGHSWCGCSLASATGRGSHSWGREPAVLLRKKVFQ